LTVARPRPASRRGAIGLAAGDMDGAISAAIGQFAEALDVGEERFDAGQLGRSDIARTAAHVVGVAELPVRAGFRRRVLVLLVERAGAYGTELSQLSPDLGELGPPLGEWFVFHRSEAAKTTAGKSSLRV